MFGLNVTHIIQAGGLALIGLVVFAESGMLVGFFLPGDTLLFSAGFFAAQGQLPLIWLLVVVVVAAIAGDNVGYQIGKSLGPRLFKKKDGVVFRQSYVTRAEQFYEKHGGKTIILARYLPIIRTFAPVVAGVGKMPRKRFIAFNLVGNFTWGIGVPLLGYWLGSKVPNIDHIILPVILGVMILSFGPAVYHLAKSYLGRKRTSEQAPK